jgi:hypothetical protein
VYPSQGTRQIVVEDVVDALKVGGVDCESPCSSVLRSNGRPIRQGLSLPMPTWGVPFPVMVERLGDSSSLVIARIYTHVVTRST